MKNHSFMLSTEQLHVVQRALSLGEPLGAARSIGPRIEIVARKSFLPPAVAVCFLASFNVRTPVAAVPGGPPPVPRTIVYGVFLLKQGLNRVGLDTNWGDFEEPTYRSMEGREWLVVVAGNRAFAADDHSSNGSIFLPRDTPRDADGDPRFDAGCTGFGRRRLNGAISLDWEGTNVVELREGDVLISCYSAFVFGWLRPATLEQTS